MTLEDVSGVPATQQISDSMCVGDASEASLDDLLLSENEEAMVTVMVQIWIIRTEPTRALV